MTELGIGRHTLHKIFRAFNFRHLSNRQKIFNGKNFPIYGTILAYNTFLFIDDSNYLQVVSCFVYEALCRGLETWICQSFSPVKSHSLPPAHEVEGPPSLLSPKAEVGLHHFSRSEARGGATVQR